MAMIDRSAAGALIPEEVSNILLKDLENQSAAFSLFTRLNMSSKTTRMPILSALPQAYWVDGDTGLKQTTSAAWSNKYIYAEPIAAIVPIPEDVLEDTSYDVWGQIRPLLADAIARAFDSAVFFNVSKPASFPTAIVAGATAASQVVVRGTNDPEEGGVPADINAAFALVEEDGFTVSGIVANTRYKGLLRNARDAEGRQLNEVNAASAYGVGIQYPMQGLWPTGVSQPEFIAGDFSHGIIGFRKDITYKLLTEATLFDENGDVLYALAQQDSVALRVVARLGYQVDNTITYANTNAETRYPWSVINAPAS